MAVYNRCMKRNGWGRSEAKTCGCRWNCVGIVVGQDIGGLVGAVMVGGVGIQEVADVAG